jgi:hypothetical protein
VWKKEPFSDYTNWLFVSLATENVVSKPSTTSLSFPQGPLSSTEKKVITGVGAAMVVEAFSPGFFGRRLQEIQDHWRKS